MTKQQQAVVLGSILGDGYLQKTGKNNARLRFEHCLRQKEYLVWKCKILGSFFQSKLITLERNNIVFGKSYQYIRAQSYAHPDLGKFHKLFYKEKQKIIPLEIKKLLIEKLSLAVWFMDDGYYYARDKMAYVYLPKYNQPSVNNLLAALSDNFNLFPILKIKKRGEYVLVFSVKETLKLMKLINKDLVPSMAYKSLPFDPVSTESSSKE